ncbi:MAG: undecaprenyl-diphosphate phosphatase [Clostridia bacterium]|nr:undecaprenyl-diphosphate phosphatase [Clostridia bacterium]
MTIWIAIFYGILQGATEFLPVSSSGHLVLFYNIFGVECNFIFFSLLLHFATLLAIVVVLKKQIWFLIKNPFCKNALQLYLATIPTIVIVLIFEKFFKSAFTGLYLPICFLITATFLLIAEFFGRKKTKNLTTKTGLIMGIAQGIAVLPGISRSGATICAGLFCGAKREDATQFSFLMSIPIILASMCYELLDCIKNGMPLFDTPVFETFVSFVFAFFVGVLCIKFMLKTLQKIKLYWFSIYLILLSILSFAL